MQRHNPHLIGIQELITDVNVQELLDYLPNHDAVWANGTIIGGYYVNYPDATLLYEKNTFEVLERGWYWLSPTPDRPSMGWKVSLFRIVIWARMLDLRSNTEFVFISTHFDNGGDNKVPSATLFMDRTGAWVEQGLPVIVTGDFNSQLDSASYQILVEGNGDGFALNNTYDMAANPRFDRNNDEFTDNYGCPRPTRTWDNCLIDHIMLAGPTGVNWRVSDWLVDIHDYTGVDPYFPSDHRAYVATVSF